MSFALLLSACVTQPPPLYYWGEYEPLLLKQHQEPGSLTVADKIELLNTDIVKAQEKGLNIPPGFYAHLGYLYFQQGDTQAGETAFLHEKQLFPESTHFIEGLLERRRTTGGEE
jgi:hypothetical protein